MTQDKELRELAIATDTELARLYGERTHLSMEMSILVKRRASILDIKTGRYYTQADLAKVETEISTKSYEIAVVSKAMEPFEATYNAHRWTRAFLVVSSTGGHVHRSMSCSTCYPETSFVWLPQYSGTDEDLIVEDAGERACTVCYPSAPVSILSRPSRIFSDDERAAQKAREERAAAKVARDAKRAAAAPTKEGTPLTVFIKHAGYDGSIRAYGQTIATEVTAIREYVHFATMAPLMKNPVEAESYRDAMISIVVALAVKHGRTTTEQRAILDAKVAAKIAKENR